MDVVQKDRFEAAKLVGLSCLFAALSAILLAGILPFSPISQFDQKRAYREYVILAPSAQAASLLQRIHGVSLGKMQISKSFAAHSILVPQQVSAGALYEQGAKLVLAGTSSVRCGR
ncbi:MAG: hypothetical protein AAGJ09_02185 [Pseudomonadota bacterium]